MSFRASRFAIGGQNQAPSVNEYHLKSGVFFLGSCGICRAAIELDWQHPRYARENTSGVPSPGTDFFVQKLICNGWCVCCVYEPNFNPGKPIPRTLGIHCSSYPNFHSHMVDQKGDNPMHSNEGMAPQCRTTRRISSVTDILLTAQ